MTDEELKHLAKQVMEYGYTEEVAIDIVKNKLEGHEITQEKRNAIINEIINKNIRSSHLKVYY